MYQLLPFVTACATALPTLPVEMWCLILRLLDAKSLLSAVRSSTYLKSIAQGDPILKKTSEDAIMEEQRELLSLARYNPVSVTRTERSRLFGTNCTKRYSFAKCPKMFAVLADNKKEYKLNKGTRKLTNTKKTSRYCPYRM